MSPRTTFHMFCTAVLFATALAALPGCDIFLGCDKEQFPDCGMAAAMGDGSSTKPDVPDASVMTQPAAERSFEFRTSVQLDSITKFVGLYENNAAIFLKNTSETSTPKWEWRQQQLLLTEAMKNNRLKIMNCTSCPTIDFTNSKFNPTNSNFYISGGTYYSITAEQYAIRFTSLTENENLTFPLLVSLSPRPFAHPSLDLVAAVIGPAIGVILPGHSTWTTVQSLTGPSSFTVGDLDYINENNGYDLISFSGTTVKPIQHQNSRILDTDLQGVLQNVINTANSGNPVSVNAAFIWNLNMDEYMDFIFADKTNVFTSSYLGKIKNQGPKFQNWKNPLITLNSISGMQPETIASVVAADLTADGYPELIVETDQAVHFYLNIPKPQ